MVKTRTAEQELANWEDWVAAGMMPRSLQTPTWARTRDSALATLRARVGADRTSTLPHAPEQRWQNEGGQHSK